MKSWLSKARKLKGVTAKQLANSVGVSLNYIQQIEGGRVMSESLAKRVYEYLGFNQNDIPFESKALLDKLDRIESEQDDGEYSFCLCKLADVGHLSYIVDCVPAKDDDLRNPPVGYEPIRIRYAKRNIEAQMALFDGYTEKQLDGLGASLSVV